VRISERGCILITLKKSDSDYSPTTMYRDFALQSQTCSAWESQSTTSVDLTAGQRYIPHRYGVLTSLLFCVKQKPTNSERRHMFSWAR